jgi:hypothetical protein
MNLRLALDEEIFCRLLGGEVISLEVSLGHTGFTRGGERLTLELCLSEELEPLRSMLMATLATKTGDARK